MKMKHLVGLLIILTSCLARCCMAQNECGECGANRVVTTPVHYGLVSGKFLEPGLLRRMWLHRVRSASTPNDPSTDTFDIKDVPQLYMGLQSHPNPTDGFEIDAGVGFEPFATYGRGHHAVDITTRANSKWRLFFRSTETGGGYVNMHGTDNLFLKQHELNDVIFSVALVNRAMGFAWIAADGTVSGRLTPAPALRAGTDPATFQPAIRGKRVTAITQEHRPIHPTSFDGAVMLGATFVDGRATTTSAQVGGGGVHIFVTSSNPNNSVNWDKIGGDGGHFYPYGRFWDLATHAPSLDRHVPRVIAPRAPHMRQAAGPQNPADMDRFVSEDVDIRMYTTAAVTGMMARHTEDE